MINRYDSAQRRGYHTDFRTVSADVEDRAALEAAALHAQGRKPVFKFRKWNGVFVDVWVEDGGPLGK